MGDVVAARGGSGTEGGGAAGQGAVGEAQLGKSGAFFILSYCDTLLRPLAAQKDRNSLTDDYKHQIIPHKA